MTEKPIDVAADVQTQRQQTQAVVVREPLPVETTPSAQATTPAQAKVDAIASLTMSAYQKAATLDLTPEETAALAADFPDEAFQPGAAGKEHLLYIEHAHLRDRFTKVFGMGQWAIIPRNRWAEPFKTQKGDEGSRVYVEAMLVVRGCFVGEAIGAMEYYPKNASQNYGDAVEGAKTAAFRRCAKEFGVGLQAWKKEFCDGWWQRRRGGRDFSKSAAKTAMAQAAQAEPTQDDWNEAKVQKRQATPAKPVSAPTNGTPKGVQCATEEQKAKLLDVLKPQRELAERYFRAIDWLLPTEPIESLGLNYVPATKREFDLLIAQLEAVSGGAEPVAPYPPHLMPLPEKPKAKPIEVPRDPNPDPNSPDAPWRSFPVPFGKHAGFKLADLDKGILFGFWANFEVETEYNGKPKREDVVKRDTIFRQMLDEAGTHYGFQKKDA